MGVAEPVASRIIHNFAAENNKNKIQNVIEYMTQGNTSAKVGLLEHAAESLMRDLHQIIKQARNRVAYTANSELTMMYWHLGERTNREVLRNEHAEYGKQIVATMSTQLQTEFGRKGFKPRNLWRMMQFTQEFPESEIVSAVSTQITWSHVIEILPLKDNLLREFYLTMAASERWSVRQLRKEIDGRLFERTTISDKPDELIKKELSTLHEVLQRQIQKTWLKPKRDWRTMQRMMNEGRRLLK